MSHTAVVTALVSYQLSLLVSAIGHCHPSLLSAVAIYHDHRPLLSLTQVKLT